MTAESGMPRRSVLIGALAAVAGAVSRSVLAQPGRGLKAGSEHVVDFGPSVLVPSRTLHYGKSRR